ncbi:hypothetical protein SISNIDRAFT_479583 [Sistotremastrum niveocremeum HHB9708]|uniref:Clavaminate synthase-like protein n=2 Tax=Sistotremastraceae TaxID=3402574 RepID=A0A164R300_9AGAM|nr:hypothetical protein SISNIDRAFT_479583 [Sistotremastrum niveocremeum HHB9708]KZT35257.1 hypothetical protein SISSUDRAFT_1025636 [Sistotremastrum suecicum HHB10207 ss-3]
MLVEEFKFLSQEQREHFLEHGWVRIPAAIPPENIKKFTENVWVRLGYDPNDKSTWVQEKIHMPRHREIPVKEFAPKAWGAMCELVGGEDRIDTTLFYSCGDSLICNFGSEDWVNREIDPRDLGNWHFDGDWFTHYLDSGEQGLTVLHMYNDIEPKAGGTYICPEALIEVEKWLRNRPEGTSDTAAARDPSVKQFVEAAVRKASHFVELTGKAGDVILAHPLMPHSASKNHRRIPRFITNPPITLKEPLNLNRSNPNDYSLVELKTLKDLGVASLPDWKITGPRRRFPPRTRAGKDATIMEEVARLKAHAEETGGVVDSMHINGPVVYQAISIRN